MPPKKKPAKKKSKKSSDGKRKKDAGDSVTFKEAILIYQLEVKQTALRDSKEDIEDLKFRVDRQKQRNDFLKKEQNKHIKTVISQTREKEEERRNEIKTTFEDVEKALQEKLVAVRTEETNLVDLKQRIRLLDEDIELRSKQLHHLIHYKEHGQTVDRTHIELLNKDMEDMKTSYEEMAEFFNKSLEAMKHTITKQNEENITKQKKLASERAIHNLDKHTEQEFLDNKWLLREVEINRHHIKMVEKDVELLEQLNVEVMSELFQHQLDDVHETRKFYLACKEAEDEEEENQNDESEVEEETIEKHGNMNGLEEVPNDMKWMEEYLAEFEAVSGQDEYKLGPMEMTLLCVTGQKATIHGANSASDGEKGNKELYKKWIVEKDEVKKFKATEKF